MRRTLIVLAAALLIASCGGAAPTAPVGVRVDIPSQSEEAAPTSLPSSALPVATDQDSPTPMETEPAAASPSGSPDATSSAPTPTPSPTPEATATPRLTPKPSLSGPANACVVRNVSTQASYDDLNAAIRSAAPGSTLTVQGTCTHMGPRGIGNAVFIIDRSLTLRGVRIADSGDPTLDGSSLAGVVWVNPKLTVTIVGLTIANGDAVTSNGGGLFNEGSAVALRDAAITNNRAWNSGGIDNGFGGVMTLINTTVSRNTSHAGGGGIYNGGTMTLTNSTVSGNTSETSAGGGIFNFANKAYANSGTLKIVDSTISGNSAAQSGGGIGNSGSEAGVAYVSISGSTITDNRSDGSGGGIYSAGQLEFIGPTRIGGNRAARGGGMWVDSGLASGSCPTSMGGLVSYEPRNAPTDYDGFTCGAPAARIYWTDANWWTTAFAEVGMADVDGSDMQVVAPVTSAQPGVQQAGYVALDPSQTHVYWAENYPTFSIRRAHLDGTSHETVVTPSGMPFGVAVSATHVYWTDASGMSIKRAALDGSAITTLVTDLGVPGSDIGSPHDLALDLDAGKMYWTNTASGWIQRADLDGSNVETIASTAYSPMGIALDAVNHMVYWGAGGCIRRTSMTGGVPVVVLCPSSGVVDVAVDPVAGRLYWTEVDYTTKSGRIMRAKLDGTSAEPVVTGGLAYPWGLALEY